MGFAGEEVVGAAIGRGDRRDSVSGLAGIEVGHRVITGQGQPLSIDVDG